MYKKYANLQECIVEEKKKLRYPNDEFSLYSQGIYDDQVAINKCINSQKESIREGFSWSWDYFLKIIALILLIIIIIALLSDFFLPKREIPLNIEPPSDVNLTGVSLSPQYNAFPPAQAGGRRLI